MTDLMKGALTQLIATFPWATPPEYVATWCNLSPLLVVETDKVLKCELPRCCDAFGKFRLEFTADANESVLDAVASVILKSPEREINIENPVATAFLQNFLTDGTYTENERWIISIEIPLSQCLTKEKCYEMTIQLNVDIKDVTLYAQSVYMKEAISEWSYYSQVCKPSSCVKVTDSHISRFGSCPITKALLLYIPDVESREALTRIRITLNDHLLCDLPAHFYQHLFPLEARLIPRQGYYYIPFDSKVHFLPNLCSSLHTLRLAGQVELIAKNPITSWYHLDIQGDMYANVAW